MVQRPKGGSSVPDLTIRERADADYLEWKDLWERYMVFYEFEIEPQHTAQLWRRLFDDSDPIECLVAEIGGKVRGIVQYLPRPNTWTEKPLCYLSDLYVDPDWRGRGIGESLILAVQEASEEAGWDYVYWETAENNYSARGLYDKITGGASGFITYELHGDDPPP
jgi:ribosomal protein S18 acetylase RimI-like enzyme